jgi:hypothetical protein
LRFWEERERLGWMRLKARPRNFNRGRGGGNGGHRESVGGVRLRGKFWKWKPLVEGKK